MLRKNKGQDGQYDGRYAITNIVSVVIDPELPWQFEVKCKNCKSIEMFDLTELGMKALNQKAETTLHNCLTN